MPNNSINCSWSITGKLKTHRLIWLSVKHLIMQWWRSYFGDVFVSAVYSHLIGQCCRFLLCPLLIFLIINRYGVKADYVSADLSKVTDIDGLWTEVTRLYSDGIDILVNNAGIIIVILIMNPFHHVRNVYASPGIWCIKVMRAIAPVYAAAVFIYFCMPETAIVLENCDFNSFLPL